MENNIYYLYYTQSQSGAGLHIPYYKSGIVTQRGRGLLDVLKSAWRFLRPLGKPLVSTIAKEGLKTATNIVGDVINNKASESLGQIARRRGGETIRNVADNIASKLEGRGRKRKRAVSKARVRCKRQKVSCSRSARLVPSIRDVFSP